MPDKTVVIKTLESIDNSEVIYPRTSIHALYDENGDPVDVAVLGDDGKIPASQSQVQSVNGQTGEVNLTADDVGAVSTEVVGVANGVAGLDESGKVPASQSRIQSVNGQTGEVSLTAADVGAQATLSGTAGQFVGFNASGAAEPQILPTEIAYVYYGQTGWNELNNHISNNKLVILRVNNTTTNRLDAELKQRTDVKAVFEGKMVDGKVKRYILTNAGAWSNEDVGEVVTSDVVSTDYQAPVDTVISFNGRMGEVMPQSGDYTAAMVGARPNTWVPTASEVGAVPTSAKGAAGGVASLDSSGKVPSAQLPTQESPIIASTTDLTPGVSTLANGKLYVVYE